jgi:high-affinity iron transporter
VIAMIGFLRRAERADAVRYVHGGWVVALLAGAATWAVATYAISISGQSRELTEGFGSLLAAVILLSVGVWMHGKAQADEWRRYIAAKMQGALSRGSAWFLFGLAFIVVYREVFETILFYAALWTQDNGGTILAGALAGVVLLAAIAWVMLRLSRTLPIAQFFRYSAILIAILAVVLAGKGVGALQEAGVIGVTPVPGVPRLTMLGLFPTAEAIGAQLLMLAALTFGFRAAARPRRVPAPAE